CTLTQYTSLFSDTVHTYHGCILTYDLMYRIICLISLFRLSLLSVLSRAHSLTVESSTIVLERFHVCFVSIIKGIALIIIAVDWVTVYLSILTILALLTTITLSSPVITLRSLTLPVLSILSMLPIVLIMVS